MLAYGQLESAQRVSNVVLHEGAVCCAAGRHPELDGGILVWALEPKTGAVRWKVTMQRDLAWVPPIDKQPGEKTFAGYQNVALNRGLLVEDGSLKLVTDPPYYGPLVIDPANPPSGSENVWASRYRRSLPDSISLRRRKKTEGRKRPKLLAAAGSPPASTGVTWTFTTHDEGQAAHRTELLDKDGSVTRVTLPDGRQVIALLNLEPFRYQREGIVFVGTVGLVIPLRQRCQELPDPMQQRFEQRSEPSQHNGVFRIVGRIVRLTRRDAATDAALPVP